MHPYLPASSIRAFIPFPFGGSLHPAGQTSDYPDNPSVDGLASQYRMAYTMFLAVAQQSILNIWQ